MDYKYFKMVKTLTEADELYRTLAKEHHPDKGGSNEIMSEINVEYAQVIKDIEFPAKETKIETQMKRKRKRIRMTKETEMELKETGGNFAKSIFNAFFDNVASHYIKKI